MPDSPDKAHAVKTLADLQGLTGGPGVAAVTAGPGVTNSLTALKNAQLAQTPLILLAGGNRAQSLGEIQSLARAGAVEVEAGVEQARELEGDPERTLDPDLAERVGERRIEASVEELRQAVRRQQDRARGFAVALA